MSGSRLGAEPVRLAPADLASAFAPAAPDRAAGLRGLVGVARRPVAETDPAPPAPAESGEGTAEAVPAVEVKNAEAAAPAEGELARQTIVVYLPVSVRDRLRAFHATGSETYTTIVLDAVEATVGELQSVLTAHRPPVGDRQLFSPRGRRRVRHEEPQVQVSLRPVREDLQVLDRLVGECQAPNRSALLAAALDRYLPPAQPAAAGRR